MFVRFVCVTVLCLVRIVEGLVPPVRSMTEAEAKSDGQEWLPDEEYFFLDDLDHRLPQRAEAVLRCRTLCVGFWAKREAKLRGVARPMPQLTTPVQELFLTTK